MVEYSRQRNDWMHVQVLRRTAIIEATVGAPGLSIPIGLADNGMPVGIQIQSRPGQPPSAVHRSPAT